MKPGYGLYRICFRIARLFIGIVYRLEIRGYEHIPKGAAMVCANHSSGIDPFFLAFAFGIGHRLHIIAKAELFKIPVLSVLLRKLGMISVDREMTDVKTIKATLGYLKDGEKVAIFPEGTRVREDDAVNAKSGAVKIAQRAGVPIVPVFMPRRKQIIKKIPVVIGEPYYIENAGVKMSGEEYAKLARELMERIKSLNPDMAREGEVWR